MVKKPQYRLRASDLIPLNIGTMLYTNRNSETTTSNEEDESVAMRAAGLFYYNLVVGLGVTALAVYGAIKGLESLIHYF